MTRQTISERESVATIAARIPEAPAGVGPSRETIAAVATAIADRFAPERIVLFGSRANGVPTSDSDVDLLVVMETRQRPFDQAWQIRQAAEPLSRVPLHISVRTPAEIRRGLAEHDFFIVDAVVLGITLFARDDMSAADGTGIDGSAAGGGSSGLKQATKEWLAKADSDYRIARRAAEPPDPIWDAACYHAQQCAEKLLEALLQEHAIRFPLTHDLVPLADLAAPMVPGLAGLRPDLRRLSNIALEVRYPGRIAVRAESERAVAVAGEVQVLVQTALGLSGVGP